MRKNACSGRSECESNPAVIEERRVQWLQLGRPAPQSHFALGWQQFHSAPGRAPQAQSFMPFSHRCAAPPAANTGCTLIAATMNTDAKTILFINLSDPSEALNRAAF
jgi:hypothetical protein